MGFKILSILFIVLLLTITASSENLTSDISRLESGIIKVNSISMIIDQNGVVSVNEELIVQKGDRVGILIPKNVQELLVSDSEGNEIAYEATPQNNKQIIAFFLEESDGEKGEEISINYNTQQITSKVGDIWDVEFSTTTTPRHTIIKINFPMDTQIVSIEPRDLYWTPVSDSELWLYPQTKDFYFRFGYKIGIPGPIIPKSTTTTTTTVPSQIFNKGISIIVLAIILISIPILLFLYQRRKVKKIKEVKEKPMVEKKIASRKINKSIMGMLDENEKKIVKILEESTGEITQAYIYKSTGIPKSSLSRIMNNLERRNIIEKKREGRTNWIKLKKLVFE